MNSTNTVDLFCRDLGGEGRPPLVVLHGLLGASRNWQTTGGDLARAGAGHVLALDLRNHGRSSHADEMSYDAMVADVLAWMDARGLRRVSLMGHSMGGKVAMAMACRHPERVERLIVVDIAPKDYLSIAHRNEFAAMNELDLRALSSRAEAEMRFEARVGDWAMRKFLTTNLERDEAGGANGGGWKWVINLPVITAALPELEANPLREGERFDGGALFVTGGKSSYVNTAEGSDDRRVIARHFPNARIETIAASGHNPHMETRAEFVRLAESFLRE
ncbi:alpha/beta fold hydrolase [Ereboglobus luteus]|uniref:Alpha/beta hydrolase n=1 Tax=Ereboglobus luteus TaxID=1796921 RepID=A0A2U8E764_9BACT|nr:alpha/beta fold hydrolase [Ereboglobus luteus]AWI10565.1 alpha/beta hydrolase [Ereboglobus luteus]